MPTDLIIDPFVHSVSLTINWETNDSRLDDALNELSTIVSIHGNPKKIRSHLRALLIICVRLYRDHPDFYVAYSRNNNFDHQEMHYNPLGLKMRSMRKVIDALRPDYLDHQKGYNWLGNKEARLSRLRPNERMIEIINRHRLAEARYFRSLTSGGIILKGHDGRVIGNYADTEEVSRMRDTLAIYNSFIEQANISIIEYEGFNPSLYEANRSYRVFKGDFTSNGRFYGGWWQNIKKGHRRDILINGHPTVELDYKANHLSFLYGLENTDISRERIADPYDVSPNVPRGIVKKIVLLSLNTDSSNGTWAALKNFIRDELSEEEKMVWTSHVPDKNAFDNILALIKEVHPVVEGYFQHKCGLWLMNLDSRIAEFILMDMTERGIPCLSIHDSFIVDQNKEEQLRKAMHDAYDFIDLPKALPFIEKVQ